jgi:glutaminase
MSLFLPLLLAGALATSAAPNATPDDKSPRAHRVIIDTVAHRQLAATLVIHARTDAEGGQLDAARAQLLTANTMFRESGGLDQKAVYSLVHIDYALDRLAEAANLLAEFAEQSMKQGDVTACAVATADAAELYNDGGYRAQAVFAVVRLKALIADPRVAELERVMLRKRLG